LRTFLHSKRFVMTAIAGGTIRFKPNVHRLLGLQNRCPTS